MQPPSSCFGGIECGLKVTGHDRLGRVVVQEFLEPDEEQLGSVAGSRMVGFFGEDLAVLHLGN